MSLSEYRHNIIIIYSVYRCIEETTIKQLNIIEMITVIITYIDGRIHWRVKLTRCFKVHFIVFFFHHTREEFFRPKCDLRVLLKYNIMCGADCRSII